MADTKVLGFNLRLKVGDKYILGTTNHSFNIEGKRKESIMKSDAGSKVYENDGRTVSFSATLYIMNSTEDVAMDIDDVRQACAANTEAAYVYGGETTGDPTVTGTCTFLKLSETSDSENYATATVDFEEVEGTGGFGTAT